MFFWCRLNRRSPLIHIIIQDELHNYRSTVDSLTLLLVTSCINFFYQYWYKYYPFNMNSLVQHKSLLWQDFTNYRFAIIPEEWILLKLFILHCLLIEDSTYLHKPSRSHCRRFQSAIRNLRQILSGDSFLGFLIKVYFILLPSKFSYPFIAVWAQILQELPCWL